MNQEPVDWTEMPTGGKYRLRRGDWNGHGVSPKYEYTVPDDYVYPDVVSETTIAAGAYVKTEALPEMGKFGCCYESTYYNEHKRIRRRIFSWRGRSRAESGHEKAVQFVTEMRRRMRR